jgi:sugar phosphate isomerase/epimerase
MKIGVFTLQVYGSMSLGEAVENAASLGLDAVELPAGNLVGTRHCDPRQVIDDDAYAQEVRDTVAAKGLEISALAVHGNQVHPVKEIAKAHDEGLRLAIEAAGKIGVDTVVAFSGCPGDRDGGSTPNWITCPWPDDFTELYTWQWEDVLAPYWQDVGAFAERHGVKIAIEMHPGMSVYNPESLLRLREIGGPAIGANFDPSHLFWQGIDVLRAVRAIGRENALFYVHAKDTFVDEQNVALNGVNDPKPYDRVIDRAWTFRSVGYGHGEDFWRAFVSELRIAGYDGVLSIEHEDALASLDEGLRRAVDTLKRSVIVEPAAALWFDEATA